MCLTTMVYVYAQLRNIFSNLHHFQIYGVTHSYSSRSDALLSTISHFVIDHTKCDNGLQTDLRVTL